LPFGYTIRLRSDDLAAMSRYLKSLPAAGGNGAPPYRYDPKATQVALGRPANDPGAKVYNAYCLDRPENLAGQRLFNRCSKFVHNTLTRIGSIPRGSA
jgi:hypothetical protein